MAGPNGAHDPGWVRARIAAARDGDAGALDELLRFFQPRARRFVERHMGARARRWADPAEVAQRVLTEVLRDPTRLPSEAGEDEVMRRIQRTANSRISDVVRNRRHDVGESVVSTDRARDPADSRPSSGAVTRADTSRWVQGLIECLPPEYADVVRMCALEELTFVEAAERLGVSADAVRKRYERARDMLARKIDQRRDG